MSGVTGRDALIAGLGGGATYPLIKRIRAADYVQNAPALQSSWRMSGVPAQPPIPTGATTCTCSTLGAIPLPVADAGKTWHVGAWIAAQVESVGPTGLWDRLAHVGGLSGAVGGLQSFSLTLPARVTDYGTVGIFVEIYAATTSSAFTVQYTNQDGVSGRATVSTNLSSMTGANFPVLQMPLQAGDTGVRSVQGFTAGTTGSAGNIGVTLARPLVSAITPVSHGGVAPGWPGALVDAGADPCLYTLQWTTLANATNRQFHGLVRAFQL